MYQRRCCNQCVTFGTPVWNMQDRTASRNGLIHRKDRTAEARDHLRFQPTPQYCALADVLALHREHPELEFHDADHGNEDRLYRLVARP